MHDALYVAARSYPGGLNALGARLGMSPNVLRNKLRREIDTHHVTVEEANLVCEFLADVGLREHAERFLQAYLAPLGMVAVRLPDTYANTDMRDLLLEQLRMSKLAGAFAADLEVALADGRLTSRQREQLQHDVQRQIEHLAQVMQILQVVE